MATGVGTVFCGGFLGALTVIPGGGGFRVSGVIGQLSIR